MRYAVISDIHANLPALTAVLQDIEQQHCDRTVCLGDIVGYGFQPNECVKLIRERAFACVKGNHDEYIGGDENPDGFNKAAATAVNWSRSQLRSEDRRWLSDLPLKVELDGFTLVHGSLDAPQRWGYVFENLDAAASFAYQDTALCFFGHTHVPIAFVRDTGVRGGTYSKFRVEPGKKYFVNAGSVGQPRDRNPKAAYVIYDLPQQTIELRRIAFERGEATGSARASV